ncbi:unnamed protein product, partial [Ectocarpus sp. 4 AP-2014]
MLGHLVCSLPEGGAVLFCVVLIRGLLMRWTGSVETTLYVQWRKWNSSTWSETAFMACPVVAVLEGRTHFGFRSFSCAMLLLLLLLLVVVVTLFARHRPCVSRFICETALPDCRFLSQTSSVFLVAWCSSSDLCRRRHHNDSLVLYLDLDENCGGKEQGEFVSSVASPPASVSTAR